MLLHPRSGQKSQTHLHLCTCICHFHNQYTSAQILSTSSKWLLDCTLVNMDIVTAKIQRKKKKEMQVLSTQCVLRSSQIHWSWGSWNHQSRACWDHQKWASAIPRVQVGLAEPAMSAHHAHAIQPSYLHPGRASNAWPDAEDPCLDNPHSPRCKCAHPTPDKVINTHTHWGGKGAHQVHRFFFFYVVKSHSNAANIPSRLGMREKVDGQGYTHTHTHSLSLSLSLSLYTHTHTHIYILCIP